MEFYIKILVYHLLRISNINDVKIYYVFRKNELPLFEKILNFVISTLVKDCIQFTSLNLKY